MKAAKTAETAKINQYSKGTVSLKENRALARFKF